MVPQVHQRLPSTQQFFADHGQAQHDLQTRSRSGLQRREAQLARVAHEDDATGHADLDTALLLGLQVTPGFTHSFE